MKENLIMKKKNYGKNIYQAYQIQEWLVYLEDGLVLWYVLHH